MVSEQKLILLSFRPKGEIYKLPNIDIRKISGSARNDNYRWNIKYMQKQVEYLERKNTDLIKEFNRYVREYPELAVEQQIAL